MKNENAARPIEGDSLPVQVDPDNAPDPVDALPLLFLPEGPTEVETSARFSLSLNTRRIRFLVDLKRIFKRRAS